ncbi:MAG TPA: peptidylprolyl isomerase [Thermoanaerobaculia bacterium]|nr:peptidylprolyl isomerase [Thermoanaerobaculia bacterium]
MKRLFSQISIVTLFATSLLATDTKSAQTKVAPSSKDASKPIAVAVINGEVLTRAQLDMLYNRLSPENKKSYDSSGGRVLFLEQYINKRLVVQQAMKESFDKRPDVAFDLQAVRESALFDRYVRDVISTEVVSEASLKSYYQAHLDDFKRSAAVRLSLILVTPTQGTVENTANSDATTKEEAAATIKAIAKQLDGTKQNFTELAIKFSEDASAKSGGDVGWIVKGAMPAALDEKAFSMKVGENSDVIESDFGYHIIRLEAKRERGSAPYEEVRGELREKIFKEQTAKIIAEINRVTSDLRRNSSITVYRENL